MYLAAGPVVTLTLVWFGYFLFRRASSTSTRGVWLILALVNGFGVIFFPLNYIWGSGDLTFIAYHLRTSEVWLAVPYELLRGGGLLAILLGLETWRERLRWVNPALSGVLLTMAALSLLDQAVRTGVVQGNRFFASVAGWSAPVLVLHLVVLGTFVLLWRKRKKAH
ncbi:MAG: hypothetical protein D6743_06720 [Calditrichaeota bacterium]|nr:MAG: hypothetical protein D6743_06720 [Calditrichota bacterium]